MWTTTGDGALRFYEGEATGSDFTDGPSTQVSGSGWNTVTALG